MRNKLQITNKRIAPNHRWRHTFGSVHTNELSPPTEEPILKHIEERILKLAFMMAPRRHLLPAAADD